MAVTFRLEHTNAQIVGVSIRINLKHHCRLVPSIVQQTILKNVGLFYLVREIIRKILIQANKHKSGKG
jgi:alanyl-tRNA synthetase